MKKNIQFLILLGLMMQMAFAQTPIKLEINHKLGNQPFARNHVVQNNFMVEFEVTNLRYYLSGFSITHDGGQVTEVPDLLVFVDVSADSIADQVIDLGAFTVNQIEAISFHMGVDSANNHLDPTVYSEDHPLALKLPSMHWGWASGYFFLSLNGNSDLNLRNQIDLQCLGDRNYFKTTVESPLVTDYSGEKLISIDGEYTGLLHGMDLSRSISMHGEFLWAKQALDNASFRVFSPSLTASYTSLDEEISEAAFSIYPNPLKNGQELTIQSSLKSGKYSWVVSDLTGKEINRNDNLSDREKISIPFHEKGFYILMLIDEDGTMHTQKIVVE